MKRALASLVMVCVLVGTARAEDAPPPPASDPWITSPLEPDPPPAEPKNHKLAAALTLGGLYAAFSVWTYFAWYSIPRHGFTFDAEKDDGPRFRWLTAESYAGGADKLGHAWSTFALARLGTEMLHQWGGYDRRKSALIGAAASEALFLAVEVVDGFHYTFSSGDFVFNTMGAALALAQSYYPQVDDLVDFRVQYWPTDEYKERAREHGDANYAEDYSGQTYYLAFHPGGIPRLRDDKYTSWTRYVDLTVGLEANGYKPDPPWMVTPEMPDYKMTQHLFVGASLNLQGIFDKLLEGDRAPRTRKAIHGFFELVQLPYTNVRAYDHKTNPVDPNHLNAE